LTNARAVLNL